MKEEKKESSFPSFAPWDITPSTFAQLLDLYPTTLKESHKRKLIGVAARKHKKQPELLNEDDPRFDRQTDDYVKEDAWRYDVLPRLLKAREEGKEENDDETEKKDAAIHVKQGEKHDSLFMHKEELVKLMDWKLKHGKYRPALAGMIKTNKPEVVQKTTADAFKAFVDQEPSLDLPAETFPKNSLDILIKPLRAVGTATASLILAVATEGRANEIPFYSDDVYLWLCLELFPGSEKNRYNYEKATRRTKDDGRLDAKYNMEEYRELYEDVFKLRHRLNQGGNDERNGSKEEETTNRRQFSCADVERVAYVLNNLDASGFPDAARILARHETKVEEARTGLEKDKRSNGKKKHPHDNDNDNATKWKIGGVEPSKKSLGDKRKAGSGESGRERKRKKKEM